MDVRERILRAALTVFTEVGFRGATTRRIAQEAGVNEITLFRHFGSKDRLLHEAIHRSDLAPTHLNLPAEPRDPRAELTRWAWEHFHHLLQIRSLLCTCLAEMDAHPEIIPEQTPSRDAMAQFAEYLRKLQDRGFATAEFDPAVLSPAFFGLLFADALGRRFVPGGYPKPPRETLEQYVDFFLRGIGVAAASSTAREAAAS